MCEVIDQSDDIKRVITSVHVIKADLRRQIRAKARVYIYHYRILMIDGEPALKEAPN